MSMTESATDDLTRDCPRDAAPTKKSAGAAVPGRNFVPPPQGCGACCCSDHLDHTFQFNMKFNKINGELEKFSKNFRFWTKKVRNKSRSCSAHGVFLDNLTNSLRPTGAKNTPLFAEGEAFPSPQIISAFREQSFFESGSVKIPEPVHRQR